MRQIARNDRNERAAWTLQPVDNRFSGLLCLQGGRKGGGAFISVLFAREEFLHPREKTKIKLFTDFSGIRPIIGLKNDGPGRTIRKVEA